MTADQTQFRAALLDATLPAPADVLDPSGRPAGKRFDVYRNNVVVSLREALATGFPLVRKLIGAQSFERLALVYLRAHPPTSPLMMHYGQSLPAFLAGFQPLAHIGYLPDCARLDLVLRRSYHAADAPPLAPETLQVDADACAALQLSLAPATIVLRSEWPIYDIWRFNVEQNAPKPRAVAQDLLITRPAFDPKPHLLPQGGATWLDAVADGHSFGAAFDHTIGTHPDFDLVQMLTLALSTGALTLPAQKDTP